jgi:uncharacterized protein (DUF302 family)
MEHDRYTFGVRVDVSPDEAEERTRAALSDQGFGVLTTIDVQSVLRDKLGVDVPAQRILGACNPQFAHRALEIEPEIGTLLPCNVVVRAHPDGGSEVVAADPAAMLSLSGNEAIAEVAAEVSERLEAALTHLEA